MIVISASSEKLSEADIISPTSSSILVLVTMHASIVIVSVGTVRVGAVSSIKLILTITPVEVLSQSSVAVSVTLNRLPTQSPISNKLSTSLYVPLLLAAFILGASSTAAICMSKSAVHASSNANPVAKSKMLLSTSASVRLPSGPTGISNLSMLAPGVPASIVAVGASSSTTSIVTDVDTSSDSGHPSESVTVNACPGVSPHVRPYVAAGASATIVTMISASAKTLSEMIDGAVASVTNSSIRVKIAASSTTHSSFAAVTVIVSGKSASNAGDSGSRALTNTNLMVTSSSVQSSSVVATLDLETDIVASKSAISTHESKPPSANGTLKNSVKPAGLLQPLPPALNVDPPLT